MLIQRIKELFFSWVNENPLEVNPVSVHGSNRSYFRIKSNNYQCLAACNNDIRENEAFIYLSNFFISKGLNVPKVLAVNSCKDIYLVEDLGDTTLYDFISSKDQNIRFDNKSIEIYQTVLKNLIHFQFAGKQDLDYSISYPRYAFDEQSMRWDLNYFKYYFLKLAQIDFDEQLLENDFNIFISKLMKVDDSFFLYRDFQSRNIMLSPKGIYFIDFQGGRKGSLHYDVASLLFDAKAEIPQNIREDLLDFYINELSKIYPVNPKEFKTEFYYFVVIRIMQAMGTYGFRGFYEGKSHFLKSIPPAVDNIKILLKNNVLPDEIKYLKDILAKITQSERLKKLIPKEIDNKELTVQIHSFSYKKGYPIDISGNGGGYVFDCRALPNPGRFVEYKDQTGKDQQVINFLEKEKHVKYFIENAFAMVGQSVKIYMERDFTHLFVAFGCTGGQHRSVYCAEKLGSILRENFNCNIQIIHREFDNI